MYTTGETDSENEKSGLSDQSETSTGESDLSDLESFIRRRKAKKRDALSTLKNDPKRCRKHGSELRKFKNNNVNSL